jgi:ankyrin repeat protein
MIPRRTGKAGRALGLLCPLLVSLLFCVQGLAQTMPLVVSLAKEQRWEQLENLLADGVNANAIYGDGTTALHWASYHDSVDAVMGLLDAGAEVNATTDLGVTALWLAAENGSLAITERLLQAGADPNVRLLSGESIVMTASQSGNGDVVRALLTAGGDANAAVTREQTALMWAANRDHHAAVKALIDFGADVHARSEVREHYTKAEKEQDSSDDYKRWLELGGNNALMFATRAGSLQSARYLVAAGADVNSHNAFGTSPLIMAIHGGNIDLVEFLIGQGADVDDEQSGHTALHAAVLRGNLEAVRTLIDAGARLESTVKDSTPVRRQSTDYNFHNALIGATPLWLAARFAEPAIMMALLDAGADAFTVNTVSYPAQDMGENYIAEEGDISLLMAAVGMGHRRLRVSWWTPERRAGQLGKSREEFILDAVTIAAQAGVDPNLTDADGQTALAFARARRYDSVVAFLEAIGASD